MGIKERHERDREAVSRAILDAARELFIAEGYGNVSIRKIAERIEYSPAAIYGYFPSKDDIFFALAEEGFRLLGDPVAMGRDPRLQAAPPLERVRALFWHFYEFSREQPQYFALIFVDRSVPRISREYERFAFMRDRKQHIIALIAQAVHRRRRAAGTLDPLVAMRLLTVGVLGIAVLRLSDRLGAGRRRRPARRATCSNLTLAGLRSGVALQSPAATTARFRTQAPSPMLRLHSSEELS